MDQKKILKILEDLDEKELLKVNEMVIAQIKELRRRRNLVDSMKYRVGNSVSFNKSKSPFSEQLTGTVERVNLKSLSVDCGKAGKWRVAYSNIKRHSGTL